MIKVENTLPDWIKKHALPRGAEVDGTLDNDNAFWFFITACCPLIFEAYAILLHPFWINWKVKRLVDSAVVVMEEMIDEKDFAKVTWKGFFSYYGKSFDINSAYAIQDGLRSEFAENNNWPIYIRYPGSSAEYNTLETVIENIIRIHGDQLTNYYYFLENTTKWSDGDVIYQGYLSELEELKQQVEINDTPNAIFPQNKEWCIISDIDLSFTYIGGTSELIDNITSHPDYEIYKLIPKYKEIIH